MTFGQLSLLEINAWIAKARWFYLLIVYVVVTTSVLSVSGLSFSVGLPTLWSEIIYWQGGVLWQTLALAVCANLLLLWWIHLSKQKVLVGLRIKTISWMGLVQVTLDLALVACLIYVSNLPWTIFPVFFFVPIVESVLFFNWVGPIAAAAVAGILANVLNYFNAFSKPGELVLAAIATGLVYLIIGFFCSYLASIIKSRSELFAREGLINQLRQGDITDAHEKAITDAQNLSVKELELTIANKRLARLDEAKSKFVAVTAHQMRTPLSAMKWTFEMLLSGQLGELNGDQREFLGKGQTSTNRLIEEVNKLLNVDTMDTTDPTYHFTESDLAGLVKGVMAEFDNPAKSKGLDLNLTLPERSLPLVSLDQLKIRIVLENLIDNAIKYTKKGGAVTVLIKDDLVNSAQSTVEVVVADEGIGISENDRDKIFQKFFRASEAVTEEPNGSGLGLYLTREIVERHGGAIWFVGRDGGGTEFHFTLPVHQKGV